MNRDMCVPCEDGLINIRVGAIIIKDGKLLMVGYNERPEYLYSVGGRVKFGETAEEAVIREVYEETGVKMEIDRLGFIHENYFYGDMDSNLEKLIYEISFFFYMKVPEDFEPVCSSFTEDDHKEYLRWIDPDVPVRYYPNFFRTELLHPKTGVRHFVTDERNDASNSAKDGKNETGNPVKDDGSEVRYSVANDGNEVRYSADDDSPTR